MIDYIRTLAIEICQFLRRSEDRGARLFKTLVDEINRLDPRDFEPACRAAFVKLRSDMQFAAAHSFESAKSWNVAGDLCELLVPLIAAYGYDHSRRREFPFVSDLELRTIVERDYRELAVVLLPSSAWKSTVVMAGSILEAILVDLLSASANKSRAEAANAAPKERGVVKDIADGKWMLHDLIEVAVELKLLPAERAKAFDQVLRDYRNFIHPKKEIRTGYPCTEAEAFMAKGALDAVCNHFS